jgi:hypothetical protein
VEDNYPCVHCGHPKNMHRAEWAWIDGAAACMISNDSPEYHLCTFKPDNLRFLEEKYEHNFK